MKSKYISKTERPDVKQPGLIFPGRILLFMALGSISVLFLGLTSAFLYTRFQHNVPGFRLPPIFHLNTAIILLSSFTIHQSILALKRDDSRKYRLMMGATLVLGITFLCFQYIGWRALLRNGITLKGAQSGSYLYVLSGLHAVHILGGVLGLAYCYIMATYRTYRPVADLLFVTDPAQKMRIGLLATYWHFVDALWLYLYVFFLVMLV